MADVFWTLLGKPKEKLWGRVESPAGWLLLAKAQEHYTVYLSTYVYMYVSIYIN